MKVQIKNVTGSYSNSWLLFELSKYANVQEGDIIEDVNYNSTNNSVQFSIGDNNCVAFPGQTCIILED